VAAGNSATGRSTTGTKGLGDWATQILLHAHAIMPCPEHGFMRIKDSHRALDYAHALAEHQPFPGKSKTLCRRAIDDVFEGLGDRCPGCD
jgi:hypothetical protein